jgi:hypothetical protein
VSANPDTTGLSSGRYLALTDAELKSLRGTKGDRLRREWVEKTKATSLDVGDVWLLYKHVAGMDIAFGKSLHKGQMHRIEWLDAAKLTAALAQITSGDVRAAFFAIDEEKFNYSNVAFWVKDQWKREGRTTVLDDHVFGRYQAGLVKLKPFVEAALAAKRHLVFSTSY